MNESNTQPESTDPYKVLTEGIKRLHDPLNELLRNHEELLIQNSSIMNNLSTIPKLTKKIESTSTTK
ncbi:MAG: hypothetical protein M5F18_06595 [Asgard group archaeon]|nr:hypothetical protein JTP64_004856 [Candida tropicalis]MCP8718951.1 hypothetical protein [Asgard group archaeon]